MSLTHGLPGRQFAHLAKLPRGRGERFVAAAALGEHAVQAYTIERYFVAVPAADGVLCVSCYSEPEDFDTALTDAKARAAQFRRAQEEAER